MIIRLLGKENSDQDCLDRILIHYTYYNTLNHMHLKSLSLLAQLDLKIFEINSILNCRIKSALRNFLPW